MYAVIDIGSNSVRMLIGNDSFSKEVRTTRLAEGAKDGILDKAAIERTAGAVRELAELAGKQGITEIYAYATEAARSASNRDEFTRRIRELSGIEVDILDGKTEAACSYFGALGGLNLAGRVAVTDIGGASTEIIVGEGRDIEYIASAPCGIVRLKDFAGEEDGAIDAFIAKELCPRHKSAPKADTLIGLGGTVSALAAVSLGLEIYDAERVHGASMPRDEIIRIAETVRGTPKKRRGEIVGLSPKRADTIYGGARILLKVMEILGVDSVISCEFDNLEGYSELKGLMK